LPTEVPVGEAQGLSRDSCVSCDNVLTIHKRKLSQQRGALGPVELRRLNSALLIALGLD